MALGVADTQRPRLVRPRGRRCRPLVRRPRDAPEVHVRGRTCQVPQPLPPNGSLRRRRAWLEKAVALLTPPSPTDNTNIDVWRFGGEYAALTETEHLTLFDPETLETTGLTTYLGEPYGQHVTGHPHHDDERGVTVGLSTYFGRQPEYRLWRQHDGRWSRESLATLPADEPAYLHSFALTDRYAVVVEFPLVVSPLRLLRPSNEAFIKRFDWDPERGTRYRVVDRETGEIGRAHV